MGISWGGSLYAWKSTHVIATIIVGFLSLVAFILYEIFVPLKEPLVPMHLFRNMRWVADIFMIALGASVYFCFAIVWPIMVFALYTKDLTKGGFLCCVTGLGTNSGQIVSGVLGKRIGKQKYQLIVAATLMGLFLGGMWSTLSHPLVFLFPHFSVTHLVSRMAFEQALMMDSWRLCYSL
jgi:hypothetical protein